MRYSTPWISRLFFVCTFYLPHSFCLWKFPCGRASHRALYSGYIYSLTDNIGASGFRPLDSEIHSIGIYSQSSFFLSLLYVVTGSCSLTTPCRVAASGDSIGNNSCSWKNKLRLLLDYFSKRCSAIHHEVCLKNVSRSRNRPTPPPFTLTLNNCGCTCQCNKAE